MAMIGMNVSADPIQTPIQTTNTPKSADRPISEQVDSRPTELEIAAQREQVDGENREIVSVSEDGDTVAVAVDAVETEEAAEGTVTERDDGVQPEPIGADSERERITAEITAPEIEPIELPEAAKAANEEAVAEANDVISATTPVRQIVSFAGYTDSQVEQMYRDGEISQADYNQEMESRDQRLENIEVSNEELSKDINNIDSISRRNEQMGRAIETAYSDKASTTTSADQRMEAIENLTERNTETARRTEDTKNLWDYQLRA